MAEQQQQQQQQQQQTPPIDYGALYGTLSAENKTVFERKGFAKAGANNGPVDINGIFDWARAAEAKVGVDTIPSPRLDNDEEFAKWPGHEKLGVPKGAKDYQFKRPDMPKGVTYDEAGETALREALFDGKIGQKQAERIYNKVVAHRIGEMTRAATEMAEAKTAMETELKTTFGASLDTAMARANMALSFIAEQAGVKVERAIDGLASLMGDGAAAIKALNWIGQQLGEDKIKGGHNNGFQDGPAAAKAEMARLNTDAEFQKAYRSENHPGHKDAVARMLRLAEQAEQGKKS